VLQCGQVEGDVPERIEHQEEQHGGGEHGHRVLVPPSRVPGGRRLSARWKRDKVGTGALRPAGQDQRPLAASITRETTYRYSVLIVPQESLVVAVGWQHAVSTYMT
jgi:hypothetical protein